MNQTSQPFVSVILPILNEESDLENCISAILQQDYDGPVEIILALGPSSDNTNQIAKSLSDLDKRIKLVKNPSGQTAKGLNLAISASSHEVICRVDGHSEISNSYLSTAIEIMQKTGAANVGGLMQAESDIGLQSSIAQAMRSRIGVGPSKFHTGGLAGESDTVYLGTYKKADILLAGGFDERYIRAQDWELNYRIRQLGKLIWFDPRLIVIYRPRKSLGKLAIQYFQYGRWRRVIARQHPETVNYRYLAPPVALIVNVVSIFSAFLVDPLLILPFIFYLSFIALSGLIIGKKIFDKMVMPLILFTMHMFWGAGFISSPKKLFKS